MIIYILILFSHLISGEQTQQCGDWEEYNDKKCLKVFNNTFVQNSSEAKNTCHQYEASSLVSIHSQEEQDFMIELIYNKYKIVNDIWIGADYKNNTLRWSENVHENYTNWANGYPKSNNAYECVSLGFVEPNYGKWLNEPCNKMNSVVCEKKQNSLLLSYLQNTVFEMREIIENLSKQLENSNNALLSTQSELHLALTNSSTRCSLSEYWADCNTFVDFRTNKRQVISIPKLLSEKFLARDNALNVCKKYNTTLVSIESEEKQVFLELFVQSNKTRVWTSGYSSAEDKKWRWINGHELTYTNWAPTQPDNGYPDEPCLELNYFIQGAYKWNDNNCTAEFLVLCEFDLN